MEYINKKILGLFVKTNGLMSRHFFAGIGHIFCFHRILPKDNIDRIQKNAGMEVSPEFLIKVINFFKDKHYIFISLDELSDILSKNKIYKERFVVFTIDDGYSDNYHFAYPVFQKLQIPFTIYLSNDFPNHKAILWWYMLEEFILKNNEISFSFLDNNYYWNTTDKKNKEIAFTDIRKLILENYNKQELLLKNIFQDFEKIKYDFTKKLSLSWNQVEELSKDNLVTIAAHTISHPPLNKLNLESAKKEILDSKKEIEERISKPVYHFAYPFGGRDTCAEREFNLVKQSGFKTATTLRQGNIFFGYKNYTERLPRIPLGENADDIKFNNIKNGIHHFSNNFFTRIIKD